LQLWSIPKAVLQCRDDKKLLKYVLPQLKSPKIFLSKVMDLYRHPLKGSFDVLEFKDGRIFERYSHPQLLDRKPVGRVWSFRDVTDRKRAEERLSRRESYLSAIIENQPGMIWLKDQKSRFLAVNRMFAKACGMKTPERVVGKTDFDIWPAELAKKYRADDFQVMKKRGSFMFEEPVLDEGVRKWHETFKTAVLDENGAVIGTSGYAHDITDRRRAEEKLSESEERFRDLFEKSEDALTTIEPPSWMFVSANTSMMRMFKAKNEAELLSCSPWELSPEWQPDGRTSSEKAREMIQIAIRKGAHFFEWTHRGIDGKEFPAEVLLTRARKGKKVFLQATIRDITHRKQAEEALKESKNQLDLALRSAHMGVWCFDIVKNKRFFDNQTCFLLGIDPAAFSGKAAEFFRVVHPEDRKKIEAAIEKSISKDTFYEPEYRVIWSDGSVHYIAARGKLVRDPGGRPLRINGVAWDITERRKMEEVLEKRILALTQPVGKSGGIEFEDLFNIEEIQKIQDEFTKATGVASLITHTDGTPITQPSNFCRLCNDIIRKTKKGLANCYRSDACIGRPNPDGPIVQNCLSGGLWDAGASISVGGRHVANWIIGQVRDETQPEEKIRAYAREIGANEEKAVEAFREVPPMPRAQFKKVAQLLFTMAKQLSQYAFQNLQQARAITESRRAEALISAGRHQLFQVIDTVPHMIFAKDMEGRFLLVNRAVAQAYGREPKDLIGVRRRDIHKNRHEMEEFLKVDREVLASGKPQLVSNELFTDVQGRQHILQTVKIPFNMVGMKEACILGVSIDVTEQRKVEEFRNDIVRTVSHELRTPLSIEKEGISLLMDELVGPVSVEQKEILGTVMRSIDRLARMITSLLDSSSIETGKIQLLQEMVDLTDLAKDVAFEFKKRAGEKGLDLSVKLPGGAVRVLADSDKITQVLSNLVDNAIKFTEKGSVEISLVVLKDAVECEVRDTGIGIAPENIGKAFQKFHQFSRTPGPGEKGFGLGLSIAKGIIELHGGRIWLESELGVGTRVKFSVPVFKKAKA
ncbi:MAG: PAS domain S-box protein, partial [Candidatus Omnitrophica bacterium]|nr:PAS domain S-box protein [Candidatus Omnitrophota bacterium]